MSKKIHEVLWTGGWDSTFRVLYLTHVKKAWVQPHYIIDPRRKSTLREIQAINEVKKCIYELDKQAYKRIGRLKVMTAHDIPSDDDVSRKYNNMRSQYYIGDQYDWLSRYAIYNNIDGLELSVHVDDRVYYFLEGKVESDRDSMWRLEDVDEDDDISIYSRFRFPLLRNSKIEMKKISEEYNFLHILEKSWFCFMPIRGKPCGICNPCAYTIEEGLGYRFDIWGILRNKSIPIINSLAQLKKIIK